MRICGGASGTASLRSTRFSRLLPVLAAPRAAGAAGPRPNAPAPAPSPPAVDDCAPEELRWLVMRSARFSRRLSVLAALRAEGAAGPWPNAFATALSRPAVDDCAPDELRLLVMRRRPMDAPCCSPAASVARRLAGAVVGDGSVVLRTRFGRGPAGRLAELLLSAHELESELSTPASLGCAVSSSSSNPASSLSSERRGLAGLRRARHVNHQSLSGNSGCPSRRRSAGLGSPRWPAALARFI